MLRALRLYYYLVTAFALLYLTNVFQNFIHGLLLNAGFTDAITLGGLLDQISSLPVFSNVVWGIVVFVLGALHWLLIRQDRKTSSDKGGVIRAIFLAGLSSAFGIRILLSLILIGRNIDTLGQSSIPIAASLAAVVAWSAALGLVQFEWWLGRRFVESANLNVALFFALLGQWVVAIMAVWATAQAIQSYLQTLIAPLPQCSPELNIVAQLVSFISRLFQQCTDTPSPGGATVTLALVAVAVFIYNLWGSRYQNDRLNNLDAVVAMAIVGITITLSGVLGIRFILDIITRHSDTVFPQSLLSTPGSEGIASYPFVGLLLAGFCLLAYYWVREWRRQNVDRKGSETVSYGLMTLSFPAGAVFFAGACVLLGQVFALILRLLGIAEASVSPDEWSSAVMLLIPGLLEGGLMWRWLHGQGGLGRGAGGKVATAGKIYVRLFLWILRLAAILSLAIFIVLVGSDLLKAPLDPTNYFWPRVIAITIITYLFSRFYSGLRRHW